MAMNNENFESHTDETFKCFRESELKNTEITDEMFFILLKEEIKEDDASRKKEAINNTLFNTIRRASDQFLGIRGHTILDAGYVFAPYIPLQGLPDLQGLPAYYDVSTDVEKESPKNKMVWFEFYDTYVPKPKLEPLKWRSGLDYAADYIDNYVERSLVERPYIDHVSLFDDVRYNMYKSCRVYNEEAFSKNIQEMIDRNGKLMSQYATKMVNNSFYGVVKFNDLDDGNS